MRSEKFIWRGNGTISSAQGFPSVSNASWPTGRGIAGLWSSKNLLWLFGGVNVVYYDDLSTYSDGILFCVFVFYLFISSRLCFVFISWSFVFCPQ